MKRRTANEPKSNVLMSAFELLDSVLRANVGLLDALFERVGQRCGVLGQGRHHSCLDLTIHRPKLRAI